MNQEQILTELQFKAIRSSGPGGQHANKVSSKVELSFHI
ncbi:MAG: aminoacyl-tRNA hydrolase, partial [Maribacter sp.]|nr:aminoacyl-tRNA hydrolase [Maribacter sp.]